MGHVRRFSWEREPLRDPGGRFRWGEDTGVGGAYPDTTIEKWSLMHMSNGGGVTLRGFVQEADQAMMVGTYARNY